jgi:hypothetical protein
MGMHAMLINLASGNVKGENGEKRKAKVFRFQFSDLTFPLSALFSIFA